MLSVLDGVRTILGVVAKLCIKGRSIAEKTLHSRFHSTFCNVLYQISASDGTVNCFLFTKAPSSNLEGLDDGARDFTWNLLRLIAEIMEAE